MVKCRLTFVNKLMLIQDTTVSGMFSDVLVSPFSYLAVCHVVSLSPHPTLRRLVAVLLVNLWCSGFEMPYNSLKVQKEEQTLHDSQSMASEGRDVNMYASAQRHRA